LNLVKNEKKRIPLHYVLPTSGKLDVKYSCMVYQYALSEKAYNYWHQKKIDLQESEGLYTTQPGQSKSNIVNINDPEETILGYFWASSRTEKRIFFGGPFENYRIPKCVLDTLGGPPTEPPYPAYFWLLGTSISSLYLVGHQRCFDCRSKGGTLTKPDFWE
jgi:hypothetical protein